MIYVHAYLNVSSTEAESIRRSKEEIRRQDEWIVRRLEALDPSLVADARLAEQDEQARVHE